MPKAPTAGAKSKSSVCSKAAAATESVARSTFPNPQFSGLGNACSSLACDAQRPTDCVLPGAGERTPSSDNLAEPTLALVMPPGDRSSNASGRKEKLRAGARAEFQNGVRKKRRQDAGVLKQIFLGRLVQPFRATQIDATARIFTAGTRICQILCIAMPIAWERSGQVSNSNDWLCGSRQHAPEGAVPPPVRGGADYLRVSPAQSLAPRRRPRRKKRPCAAGGTPAAATPPDPVSAPRRQDGDDYRQTSRGTRRPGWGIAAAARRKARTWR